MQYESLNFINKKINVRWMTNDIITDKTKCIGNCCKLFFHFICDISFDFFKNPHCDDKNDWKNLQPVFRRTMKFGQSFAIIFHIYFGLKYFVCLIVFVNFVVGNAHISKGFYFIISPTLFLLLSRWDSDNTFSQSIHSR